MTTLWKFQVYFFVRASDVTTAMKQAFAQVYEDAGWMEGADIQIRMFDSVHKFSMTGELPAQVYGLSTPAMESMKDMFKALLDVLPDSRYAVAANTTLPNYADGELILTNFPVTPNGQIIDWDKAVKFLENEYGLIEIVEESEEP